MLEPDKIEAWDDMDAYVQRMVRRKLRVSVLQKIQGLANDRAQDDRQNRRLAFRLMVLFVIVIAGVLVYLATR